MKLTRTMVVFLAAWILSVATVHGSNLTFDGITTGGWTLLNEKDGFGTHTILAPVANYAGTGLNGVRIIDTTEGVAYYSAPASLLATDLTGTTLSFRYEIEGTGNVGPYTNFVTGFEDLYVNGSPISGLDVIDDSIIDSVQSVTINFADSAFNGIDLSNLSSLYIRAEWWSDGGGGIESNLLGVPEPTSISLLMASLLGMLSYFRRR